VFITLTPTSEVRNPPLSVMFIPRPVYYAIHLCMVVNKRANAVIQERW